MPVNLEALTRFREQFKARYPDFQSFTSPGATYLEDEDRYKREASRQVRLALQPYVGGVQTLTSDQAARDLALPLIQATNLMSWYDIRDLRDLFLQRPGDWSTWMSRVLDVIRAGAEWQAALQALASWQQDCGFGAALSNVAGTYFPFLWDPDRHMFIKPRNASRFLKQLGIDPASTAAR